MVDCVDGFVGSLKAIREHLGHPEEVAELLCSVLGQLTLLTIDLKQVLRFREGLEEPLQRIE